MSEPVVVNIGLEGFEPKVRERVNARERDRQLARTRGGYTEILVEPIPFGQETDWVCWGCHPELESTGKCSPRHFGNFDGIGRSTTIWVDGELHQWACEAWAGTNGWVVETPPPPVKYVACPRGLGRNSGSGKHGYPIRRRYADVEVRIHGTTKWAPGTKAPW